ncbi:ribbon-helix-helix domain-containing protein [Fluviibacterium sp. DFM31]|uniref:Ribbon-helix-helix domain-containing protein n=1 Tax=Meridianimarinicoccus marinus TaxID=3231483 RepID=A0ABV3L571_9RHOB
MTARPRKRSLTLHGHATSVSLEDAFWEAFRQIAAEEDLSVNALAAQVDEARGLEVGLATAIRLFVLSHTQEALARARSGQHVTADDISKPPL